MGITNNIPPSRLIQPGVIDNAAARPASPFEGQCIFQKDTDQLLVWNGTAWVIPNQTTQNPGGLELVKTQTLPTGLSSINISDAFSSEFDNYKITISNASTSTGQRIDLRMGTTIAGYYSSLIYHPYGTGTGTPVGLGSPNTSEWQYAGWTTPSQVSFNVDVDQPFLSKNTFIRTQHIQYANAVSGSLAGFLDNNTSYTSFTLLISGGATFTGGTIRVYGYRK